MGVDYKLTYPTLTEYNYEITTKAVTHQLARYRAIAAEADLAAPLNSPASKPKTPATTPISKKPAASTPATEAKRSGLGIKGTASSKTKVPAYEPEHANRDDEENTKPVKQSDLIKAAEKKVKSSAMIYGPETEQGSSWAVDSPAKKRKRSYDSMDREAAKEPRHLC